MIPLIALVGRPNVGKSTLFNRLTRSRKALVDDTPGLTRDRQYGVASLGGERFNIVDTGGFLADPGESVAHMIRQQALVAVEEADAIIMVTDVRDGLMADDYFIADLLRKSGKPVICAVNKSEGNAQEMSALLFHELGLAHVVPVSAAHGLGMDDLLATLLQLITFPEEYAEPVADQESVIRVAVVGSPNAGKSSLLNRLLGEERLIISDIPGTTRDSVRLPYTDKQGRVFELVDTAGIRRKARISMRVEKFCVIAALRAMDRAQVTILVLDALRGITTQDQRIASHALESGCGLVLAINKWDLVVAEHELAIRKYHLAVQEAFPRFNHAPLIFVSAATGWRVNKLTETASKVWENQQRRVATGPLNRWLEATLAKNPPPRVAGGRAIKFRYATQVTSGPPTVALFTNFPEQIPEGYRRFLENQLRETFQLQGTPIRLNFRRNHDDRFDK